jgi:hypothetical protein
MDANTLDGLEVNASEKFIPLKISCYIDCKNQKVISQYLINIFFLIRKIKISKEDSYNLVI